MKKIIVMLIFSIQVFANTSFNVSHRSGEGSDDWGIVTRSGEGVDNWKTLDIIDLAAENEKVEKLKGLIRVGDYSFDDLSDRWVLKTKTRLLSVKDIELVDKFESKQNEVKNFSNNMRSRNSRINNRFLKSMLERSIKFQKYEVNDFEY